MTDRADYELLELAKVDQIEIEVSEPPAPPDEGVFVILGETIDGEKVAISIPFPELDDILGALTATTKQFPEGRFAQ